MLNEQTLLDFTKELASNSPAPGGGSVAALAAAEAAALFHMVATLTVSNKKYEAVHEEMAGYLGELEEKRRHFLEMIDTDANAFNGVMAAFKLPKETEEEKAIRRSTIQAEYKKAASVPLSVGLDALTLLPYAAPLIARGNQSAITDVGVGLLSLRTALIGAFYNVKINLGAIKDAAFVEEMRETMARALSQAEEEISALLAQVETQLEA